MDEKDFWSRLEWRICSELAQFEDKSLRHLWCDGLIPERVEYRDGAAYIVGLEACLIAWRPALTPGGAIAFSEPVNFVPQDADMEAFWEGVPVRQEGELDADLAALGWTVMAGRRVEDAGGEAYYEGVEARCDALDRCAAPAIRDAVAANRAEAAAWRRLRDRVGYALRVVRAG